MVYVQIISVQTAFLHPLYSPLAKPVLSEVEAGGIGELKRGYLFSLDKFLGPVKWVESNDNFCHVRRFYADSLLP